MLSKGSESDRLNRVSEDRIPVLRIGFVTLPIRSQLKAVRVETHTFCSQLGLSGSTNTGTGVLREHN